MPQEYQPHQAPNAPHLRQPVPYQYLDTRTLTTAQPQTIDTISAQLIARNKSRPWLILFGFIPYFSWIMPLYVGVQLRSQTWRLAGIGLGVVALLRLGGASGMSDIAGVLFFLMWILGLIATAVSYRALQDAMNDPVRIRELAAQQLLRNRNRAKELTQSNPELAATMGIGEPGNDGNMFGLIDVNNAPDAAFKQLEIEPAYIHDIVEARNHAGPFESAYDLDALVNLPPDVVDYLVRNTVYLPLDGTTRV